MKAHCIFCGNDFRDLNMFEVHLHEHKELNARDRRIYLAETKREIEKHERKINIINQAKLKTESFEAFKTKVIELISTLQIDKNCLTKITNSISEIQIKKILTNNLKSYHELFVEKQLDFYYVKERIPRKEKKRKKARKVFYDSTTSSIRPILIASGNKR